MADVIDINEMRKEFQEKIKAQDLKSFAESQYKTIEKLMTDLEVYKAKTKQLEMTLNLLSKKNIISSVSPEEMICIEQIASLKIKSSSRDLTLEETKKLDILVKSLKLIREENPKDQNSIDPSASEEDDLVAIATGKANN